MKCNLQCIYFSAWWTASRSCGGNWKGRAWRYIVGSKNCAIQRWFWWAMIQGLKLRLYGGHNFDTCHPTIVLSKVEKILSVWAVYHIGIFFNQLKFCSGMILSPCLNYYQDMQIYVKVAVTFYFIRHYILASFSKNIDLLPGWLGSG